MIIIVRTGWCVYVCVWEGGGGHHHRRPAAGVLATRTRFATAASDECPRPEQVDDTSELDADVSAHTEAQVGDGQEATQAPP